MPVIPDVLVKNQWRGGHRPRIRWLAAVSPRVGFAAALRWKALPNANSSTVLVRSPAQREQRERIPARSLANDAIVVGVAHVLVRRVRTRDRGDPVPACFLAGNLPISVVVVACERIVTGGGTASGLTR